MELVGRLTDEPAGTNAQPTPECKAWLGPVCHDSCVASVPASVPSVAGWRHDGIQSIGTKRGCPQTQAGSLVTLSAWHPVGDEPGVPL